jgi:hypothetical protein
MSGAAEKPANRERAAPPAIAVRRRYFKAAASVIENP